MHRALLDGFFRHAGAMLRPNGEVHVSHKISPPYSNWNIEVIASQNFLELIECVEFRKEDYPEYNHKRGASLRCDEPFPLGACSTFKFRLFDRAIKMSQASLLERPPQKCFGTPIQWRQQPQNSFGLTYPHAAQLPNVGLIAEHVNLSPASGHITGNMTLPFEISIRKEYPGFSVQQLHDMRKTPGTFYDVQGNFMAGTFYDVQGNFMAGHYPGVCVERYDSSFPSRTLNGDLYAARELQHINGFRVLRL
ncbi:hypothetical protein CRG98_040337 [Punica granatum]|nr:hypothetical protein CRG98_040337 [Punica granatum]